MCAICECGVVYFVSHVKNVALVATTKQPKPICYAFCAQKYEVFYLFLCNFMRCARNL